MSLPLYPVITPEMRPLVVQYKTIEDRVNHLYAQLNALADIKENDPDTEDIDACIDYVEGRIATNKMKLKLIVQELDELHEWYVFQCENGAFGGRTIPRKRGKSDTVSKRMQSFAQNTVKRVK